MKQYDNFISLGYFCSVSLELEKIGLRSFSSPFDWCISNFKGVEKAIYTKFEDFLNYENMYQNREIHNIYLDRNYDILFAHDFDKYTSLKEQLPKVKEKYKRRIEKFYNSITKPTLFIRYISDENGLDELKYIEKNYKSFIQYLKTFNAENDIIFIANKGISSNIIKIYSVEKDDNDKVARRPLDKNKELYDFLNNCEFKDREKNKQFYNKKQKNYINKIYNNSKKILFKILKQEYIHDKQI